MDIFEFLQPWAKSSGLERYVLFFCSKVNNWLGDFDEK